jgi:hypothetical protein
MTAFAGAMMLTIELDAQDLGRITFADEPEFADEAVAEFVSRPAALGEMDVGAMRAGVGEPGLIHNFMLMDEVSPACRAAADRVAADLGRLLGR